MKMFGKEVRDTARSVELTIRRPDVRDGIDRNPESCVVARALKRTLNGAIGRVKIGARFAYVEHPDHVERFALAQETKNMIRGYDKGGYYPTGVIAKLIPAPPTRRLSANRVPGKSDSHNGKGKPNVRSESTPWLRHALQEVAA